jgi:hypothetical protein
MAQGSLQEKRGEKKVALRDRRNTTAAIHPLLEISGLLAA